MTNHKAIKRAAKFGDADLENEIVYQSRDRSRHLQFSDERTEKEAGRITMAVNDARRRARNWFSQKASRELGAAQSFIQHSDEYRDDASAEMLLDWQLKDGPIELVGYVGPTGAGGGPCDPRAAGYDRDLFVSGIVVPEPERLYFDRSNTKPLNPFGVMVREIQQLPRHLLGRHRWMYWFSTCEVSECYGVDLDVFGMCPHCERNREWEDGSDDRTHAEKMRAQLGAGKRFDVLERDNFTCQACGRSRDEDDAQLHVDHIKPVSKGGTNDMENLQALCEACNLGKSDKRVEQMENEEADDE